MAGSRRLKRVSWAPDVSLCKVRLFLSEDAPYQCAHGFQDHLQAKGSASFMMHASVGPTSDDSALPPGFESTQNLPKINKTDISQIPLIKWRPPLKIVVNLEWHVVSGEESEEINKQNNRNFGVLEAIYPRQSTIPPNPSISSDAQESEYNDNLTPLIPLTVIEEEEEDDPSDPSDPETEPEYQPDNPLTQYPQPQIPPPNNHPPSPPLNPVYSVPGAGAEVPGPVRDGPGAQADVARILAGLGAQPDVAAAVSAALTALMRSSDKDSLIDHNLLIKILSDPSTVDKLVSQHANPNPNSNPNPSLSVNNVKSVSAPPLPPMPSPVNVSSSFSYVRNPNPNSTNPNPNPRSSQQTTPVIPVSAPVQPPLPLVPHPTQYTIPPLFNPNPNPRVSQPMAPSFTVLRPNMTAPMNQERDSNYYMTLIQQHGGENGGNLGLGFSGTVQKNQTGTSKIQKPCFYFNSAKGCRHGASCMFLHDNTSVESIEERNNNKRVKVDSNEWYCL